MPLASVPSIELDPSGEPVLLGRSGKSSHYQLSTNKFISRVHVRAAYIAGTSLNLSRIELVCEGWNGVKIHCQGKAWELGKDDSFTSESQDADIMIDVQDARVLLRWPKLTMKVNTPEDTDSNPDSENSPRRVVNGGQHPSPFMSPLRNRVRLQSPVSPTPANQHNLASPSSFLDGSTSQNQGAVQIYEDDASENENADQLVDTQQSTQLLSQPLGINLELSQSYLQEFSDQDEENDPIIHSFGPYGANLLPRMASFTATSPENRPVNVFEEPPSCPEKKPVDDANNPILNHTINQLAYSRLSSTPLSTIMTNLPTDVKAGSKQLTLDMLKALIDRTACLGEVPRAGKDAAGKPLESEYYYIPDKDFDEMRRDAVVEGLRKPGLRNCRKQHKVTSIAFSTCSSRTRANHSSP